MNKDTVKGKWEQLSRKIKHKLGKKRTDNDPKKTVSHQELPDRQATRPASGSTKDEAKPRL